jgi:hypothetical protein
VVVDLKNDSDWVWEARRYGMKEELLESVRVVRSPGKEVWNNHWLKDVSVERNMMYLPEEESPYEKEHVFPGHIVRRRHGRYPNNWGKRGDDSGSRSGIYL